MTQRIQTAATIRGRLLFICARSTCGYYSRAATIRGAATIRVITVCNFHGKENAKPVLKEKTYMQGVS